MCWWYIYGEGIAVSIPHSQHTYHYTKMPAQRFTPSTSASLSFNYRHHGGNQHPSRYNSAGRPCQRGASYLPYPESNDVFLRSSVECDDESWGELGLSDFIVVNQRIGRCRFNLHQAQMLESQRGLLLRGLELWDADEVHHPVLEASIGYTASVGMMLYEQVEFQRGRVSV